MIIFNLWAIPVGLLIALVYSGLTWLFPSWGVGSAEFLTIGLVAAIVGGISEVVGMAGRLFFLPIWLLGLLSAGYGAWQAWGMVGLIVAAVVLVAAVGALLFFGIASEKKYRREAPLALANARAAAAAGNFDEFWKQLKTSYSPGTVELDQEFANHFRSIFELLLEGAPQLGLGQAQVATLHHALRVCHNAANGTSPEDRDRDLLHDIEELIHTKGQWQPEGASAHA